MGHQQMKSQLSVKEWLFLPSNTHPWQPGMTTSRFYSTSDSGEENWSPWLNTEPQRGHRSFSKSTKSILSNHQQSGQACATYCLDWDFIFYSVQAVEWEGSNSSYFCGLERHSQSLVSGRRHDLCSRVTSAGNECFNDSYVAWAFKRLRSGGNYCDILVKIKEVEVRLCSAVCKHATAHCLCVRDYACLYILFHNSFCLQKYIFIRTMNQLLHVYK